MNFEFLKNELKLKINIFFISFINFSIINLIFKKEILFFLIKPLTIINYKFHILIFNNISELFILQFKYILILNFLLNVPNILNIFFLFYKISIKKKMLYKIKIILLYTLFNKIIIIYITYNILPIIYHNILKLQTNYYYSFIIIIPEFNINQYLEIYLSLILLLIIISITPIILNILKKYFYIYINKKKTYILLTTIVLTLSPPEIISQIIFLFYSIIIYEISYINYNFTRKLFYI